MLFGNLDKNINYIEKEFGVKIRVSDNNLKIIGDESISKLVSHLLDILFEIIEKKENLSFEDVRYAINMEKQNNSESIKNYLNDILVTTYQGKPIRPKTIGQKRYVDIIRKNGVVFGIGPAGTGKTYLAMAMAIEAFKNKEVSRIILTRPAVEAGESLGFLPGDLQEKIDPYLRPLYDALFEIMGPETYQKLMEKGNIEVAPLAYMRGRTLDNSYVILDEAQNTTPQQMKMFLTRLGYGSKAIITGDITQLDLPNGKKSGLITIRNILKNVEGIEFVDLDKNDVVRHPLVQRIIDAYDKYEKRMNDANSDR
ncbi:PhoH family protein [Helcococcus ovis]|uniref:PhoH family protein n=1 Tax=Helcococcus TaxID=31983 RepID=UPI00106F4695|nr:PhoH family protein [Helcococcus ovis]TFF67214.1 PhoH family protein [Helcococcus ovis]WNZ02073.1 PhoH family protein [Helcococcus ovis]